MAIVTGGARGLGRAIAERLGAEGAALCLFDLPGSGVGETAAALNATVAGALAVEGDVAAEADAARAIDAALARFGRVDILVNNAGVAPMVPFLDTDAATFDRVMAINVRGSFLFARQAARAMAARGGGVIVQIASTCAFTSGASRGLSAYNMSKAAVRQMVASLAGELAPHGIRVNAIAPGTIDTAMTRACFPDEAALEAEARRIPLGRLGRPGDVAAACAFLCSDDAAYVTGDTLLVDGGWMVR